MTYHSGAMAPADVLPQLLEHALDLAQDAGRRILSVYQTDFAVTHNIGNQDVSVTVREVANPKAVILVNYEVTSNSVITIKFDTAPASGVAYRVVVLG